jgi:hypothetical protein
MSLLFSGIIINENNCVDNNYYVWKLYIPDFIIEIKAEMDIKLDYMENKNQILIEVLWEICVNDNADQITEKNGKMIEYVYSTICEECKRMSMFFEIRNL